MKTEKKRILHVLGHLRRGGAEYFILSMYRALDEKRIVFDVLTRGENIPEVEDEITKRGGKVYRLPEFPRHSWKNYRALKLFLKEHAEAYQAIHVHANSMLYIWPLKLAKKYGIPIRILHSHNTRPANSVYKVLHYVNRACIEKYVTNRVACSGPAGEWMFGKNSFERIHNAIDVSRFSYNVQMRERLRKQYNVTDKLVIGTVGRLERQKNQLFLLEVFCEVRRNTEAVLFIIGEGTLEKKLKQYAKEKGVEASVYFLKNIPNVYDYLQMMDVFAFPSLYEGLGISVIEAQASGVEVVISDRVPQEAVLVPEIVRRLSGFNAKEWSDAIAGVERYPTTKRKSQEKTIRECGYDITEEVKRLVELYEA